MSKIPEYAIYVSAVPGKTFIRPGSKQVLGGSRINLVTEAKRGRKQEDVEADIAEHGPVRWNDRVYPIPVAEYGRYRKEYHRALDREGSLKKRTEAEWQAQEAADAKAQKAAREDAAAKQKAAEARMAPQPEASAPLVATDTP
jgi:hypothetical protein